MSATFSFSMPTPLLVLQVFHFSKQCNICPSDCIAVLEEKRQEKDTLIKSIV